MNILGELIQNASLLLALVLAHGLSVARLPHERLSTQVLIGLLFGVTALLGMVYPVTVGPLIFDGRTIVISMAGLFGGIPAAAISSLIAVVYRAWLGGPGVAMGIATVITAAALGALFYELRRAGRVKVNFWTLVVFGLAVHLVALGWIVLLPTALREQVLTNVALPFLIVLPGVVVLIGLLLRDQEQRVSDERALRESQARLIEARSIAGLGDWEWDSRSGVQRWSDEVYRFLGLEPSSPPLTITQLRRALTPRTWADLHAALNKGLQEGEPWCCDVELRREQGSVRWISVRGQVVYDQAGQRQLLRGTVQDVTEARTIRHALARERSYLARERDRIQELHERIEKIAAHVPGMIFQYQRWPDGRSAFPFASQGVKAIYGVDPARVMEDASPAFAMLHPDDLERIKASIERSAEELTIWQETYRVRRPDGRTQWLEGEASPQRQPDGSVLWHGYIHDVTQRQQAETQLRLAASVFAHSLEGIAITDAQNRLVDINPSFTRITGYSKAELLGCDPKLLASGQHDAAFYQRMWAAISDDGFWQGEIWNQRKDGEVYPELLSVSVVHDQAGGVLNYIGVFSDISQFKAHEAELNRIANYDHLTGLPNRRLLTDRLEHAIAHLRRTGNALAVCYLDLDGFKPVNDRYGHAVGDRLLVKVSEALRQVLRGDDTVARLGGDEFVLLLTDFDKPDDCFALLNRVLDVISEPISIGDQVHSLSASIGVTSCPPDIADPDALLRHADQAMYQAKESGKNTYHLYDAKQDHLLQARRQKLERIGRAVAEDELILHFQPQVDMISRELIGVEALVRWQHPEQGLLLPGAFLPDIEGTELEVKLDEWVIESVLRQLETWTDEGQPLPVSVNIGARHLLRPDFAANLEARLKAHPSVAGKDLELEILETATLSDFEQAQRVLARCRELGVRFALDDFGTGYSSLAYFRALPVDLLKIDQSFVRDMLHDLGDKEIVESVVQLSTAFNRPVIAEGVETLSHAAMLTWLGCRFGQGYGIARPMPATQLSNWIASWSVEQSWSELDGPVERDDLPLMLAAQNHRRWLHVFLRTLEQAGGPELAELRPDDVDFGHWYAGAGRRRYKTFAEFRPIGSKYERLQAVAADLLGRIQTDQYRPTVDRPRVLQKASDDLITEIGRLIQRVTPGVRPPSRSG